MEQIDQSLLLWFNSYHTGFLDQFMLIYTGKYVWFPFYAAIFLMMQRAWGWRKALVLTLGIGLCVAITDQICASVLRPWISRPRPSHSDSPIFDLVNTVDNYRGGRSGFPSCHGANSAVLATAGILIVRLCRFTVMILLWAVINCFTRLYLGVHYPGDIIAGVMIGTGITLAVMIPLLARMKLERCRLRRAPSPADLPTVVFGVTLVVITVMAAL